MSAPKLLVASARLPVTLARDGGDWTATASPGGLATALRSVAAQRPFTWIGLPGTDVPPEEEDAVRAALSEHGLPVFVGRDDYDGFYEQFSNRVLWPLLHALRFPLRFDRQAWESYQRVNQRIAEAVAEQASPGDTIWVHDYQLALVPGMLRAMGLDCSIGYFLHIPFPSSETFRTLPVREEILSGMLGANFVGFHAYEYVSHFRNSALRILGLESDPESVLMPTHHASLGVLPIGIEPDEIDAAGRQPEVRDQFEILRSEYAGKKIVLGIDRLDYTKGLPQKLLAIEELLAEHPELCGQFVFLQVAAPSRTGVVEYQELKREIDELVGRINGRFGTLDFSPIVYVNQNVPRDQLVALYQLADVMLVTPIRDGMNLVALEYVAARGDRPGTLILSEFTGAATCLSGAMLVNPYNPNQIAAALAEALEARQPSRQAFEHMRDFVTGNTSIVWAERFLDRLDHSYAPGGVAVRLRLGVGGQGEAARGARAPLVFLDYDGTLQPHTRIPSEAVPAPRVLEVVAALAERATVYVVSGRSGADLEAWLGELPVGLVCEHGLQIRHPGGAWSEPPKFETRALTEVVEPLFREFCERTPGSRVEHKAASLAWHYRGSDPKLGAWRARELRSLLEDQLSGHPYAVLPGSKVIEVRHAQVTKGHAVEGLLGHYPDADFVFCAGNDRTDEDMFEALARAGREPRMVCFVGSVHSSAEFFVDTPAELLGQLETLAGWWRG